MNILPTTLVIKLGGLCNLNCEHCHCKRIDYSWNEDILDYIKAIDCKELIFSGGEPLLYIEYIRKIIEKFGMNIKYKLVSNGTSLTPDIVNLFNSYNVHYSVSYDGETSSRDTTIPIAWKYISNINNHSIATLYLPTNTDINSIAKELQRVSIMHNLQVDMDAPFWINFPHQTTINHNTNVTIELAQQYCSILGRFLELDFKRDRIHKGSVLGFVFNRMIRKRSIRGVRCCNENKVSLAINGDFLLCPYDDIVVGNIYDGIDWDKVESYIPERCKGCPLWESCMNTCIANITENECYISKVLHKHFYKLMDKYGYTYEQLEELIKE